MSASGIRTGTLANSKASVGSVKTRSPQPLLADRDDIWIHVVARRLHAHIAGQGNARAAFELIAEVTREIVFYPVVGVLAASPCEHFAIDEFAFELRRALDSQVLGRRQAFWGRR